MTDAKPKRNSKGDTSIETKMRGAMERIDAIYLEGFTAENLVALLRIANYAARQAASLSNAMLVQGDENADS